MEIIYKRWITEQEEEIVKTPGRFTPVAPGRKGTGFSKNAALSGDDLRVTSAKPNSAMEQLFFRI
jgi:hypothetical protein